ncbi:MAG: stealth family protein [Rikenellaceae bacterium]
MKIDIVYLWVDGSDATWIAKKNQYLPQGEKSLDPEIAGDCRFVDRDELKYSLRSLERYAPWINHIYIVTDSQRPKWLKESVPNVTIVDHREIIPSQYLPLFNSSVIELFIHKIEGLSEHFLYANDDMLFGREVAPSFFFHQDGEPIVRQVKRKIKRRKGAYQRQIYHMQMLICERYSHYFRLAPHHNIDAYRRSDYEQAMAEFATEVEQSLGSRFRQDGDMQRAIVSYRLLATSSKKLVRVGRYNGAAGLVDRLVRFFMRRYITDSRCFPICLDHLEEKIKRYNPALYTINDESRATPEQRQAAMELLERLLPEKSSFEI